MSGISQLSLLAPVGQLVGFAQGSPEVLVAIAVLSALVCGALGFRRLAAWRGDMAKRMARRIGLGAADGLKAKGVEGAVLSAVSRLGGSGAASSPRAAAAAPAARRGIADLICRAGLEGRLSDAGVSRARVRLCLLCGLVGALVGVALSAELAVLLGAVMAVLGWMAPTWALRRCERERVQELERCLPEMLEVVALGMRSGLSFDRSFLLYGNCFPSAFARACVSAQRSWTLGLRTREEALRELAEAYRSEQFTRVVERIVRSLRFGSSLAPDLEAAAAEARARRRALVEERVAKAPVKMMVPTGALILPAMLLLVLGPVLLELIQGV